MTVALTVLPWLAVAASHVGSATAWVIFSGIVIILLGLDLGILHRRAREQSAREAVVVTLGLAALAGLFAVGIALGHGGEAALQFATGYVVEEALSVDNLFVFLVIFNYFKVPPKLQHRVLFWGVFGALAMRAVFIAVGTALVAMFHWIFYVFGVFLLITGIKLALQGEQDAAPDDNALIRLYKRAVPTSNVMHGAAFIVKENGRWLATPLLLVLVVVEVSDILFAVDSIPAIFAVTTDPFLVYTSNVFAILGLRSLFFVLAGMMNRFHLLKYGLGVVLAFIGTKMLVADFYEISTLISLAVIAGVLLVSVLASLLTAQRDSSAPQAARKDAES